MLGIEVCPSENSDIEDAEVFNEYLEPLELTPDGIIDKEVPPPFIEVNVNELIALFVEVDKGVLVALVLAVEGVD
jgi:hypothetical protein